MKSKFNDIVKAGISYNQEQIKKLEKEIAQMIQQKKSLTSKSVITKIDDIIKHDKNLIAQFKEEIKNLKKRLK